MIYIPHSCGVFWYIIEVSMPASGWICIISWHTQWSLFCDNGYICSGKLDSWAHCLNLFQKKKEGMYYLKTSGRRPSVIYTTPFLWEQIPSYLLFLWMNKWSIVVNWIFWPSDIRYAFHMDWNVSNVEKITNSLTWACNWTWLDFGGGGGGSGFSERQLEFHNFSGVDLFAYSRSIY